MPSLPPVVTRSMCMRSVDGCVVSLVTWQGVVDHEQASIYHMVVVARDQGHDPPSSRDLTIMA